MQPTRTSLGLSTAFHALVVTGAILAAGLGWARQESPPPQIRIRPSIATPPPSEVARTTEPPPVEARHDTDELPDPPIAAEPFEPDDRRVGTRHATPEAPRIDPHNASVVVAPRHAPPEPVVAATEPTELTPDPAEPAPRHVPPSQPTPFVEARTVDAENAPPTYPRIARRRGWEGEVWLRFSIDASGAVTDVHLLRSSGHEVLDRAALAAAQDWTFTPALRDGSPVASERDLPVEFRLEDGR